MTSEPGTSTPTSKWTDPRPPTFLGAISTCLQKFAEFSGRATRQEFQYFSLFYFTGAFGLGKIEAFGSEAGVFGTLFALIFFLPMVAVLVRLLHDTGRSGYWALFFLVPIVGPVVVFFFTLQSSA